MPYFQKTYAASRAAFLEKAHRLKSKYPATELLEIRIPDEKEKDLFTDVLYLPDETKKENLIVVTSGVHGIEGFTGSAIQQLFLDHVLTEKPQHAFLFVHSINPFGHKFYRRVSSHNVDLNRNFDLSDNLFSNDNPAYAAFRSLLNPTGPYRRKTAENLRFILKTWKALRHSDIKTFRQAVLQGQYTFEKGIFFGGKQFEPQKEIMEEITCRFAKKHHRIILIDIHTGYGYRGRLHLIGMDDYPDPQIQHQLQQLYPYDTIEAADKDKGDFYKISGSMFDFIYKLCDKKNKTVLPMAWEFGTFDNIKTLKSLASLRIMLNENQGFHYGYANDNSRKKVTDEFRNLYYPDDPSWRKQVLEKGFQTFETLLKNLDSL